jgi:outer membrane lipoprotein-sorting protein
MKSRRRLLLVTAAVAALALIVGVGTVAATGAKTLPTLTAPEILTKMAQAGVGQQSVSGEVAWANNLLGAIELPSNLAQTPAQSPLLGSGSGRLWVSRDGARIESQGSGGDKVAAVSKADHLAWTYDSATNTAKRYELPSGQETTAAPAPSTSAEALTPAMIEKELQAMAGVATVRELDQTTVAGRAAYVLEMTPAAADTALGAVRAAIDGETMLPLRVEVFAKGGTTPVLDYGFTSITYGPVDASLFAFTAPQGAEVTTEKVAAPDRAGDQGGAPQKISEDQAHKAQLTYDEAARLVDYPLARARGYEARPFRWAYVFAQGGPQTAAGTPVFGMAGLDQLKIEGPSSALVYGSGFGTIVLLQTKTTDALKKQLEQVPALPTSLGNGVRMLYTPLGGVVIWEQDGTTLAAAGMVSAADMEAFVRAVR